MAKVIFDNGIAYEGTPEEIVDIVAGLAEKQDRIEKEKALKLYDYVKVLVSKRGKDGGIVQIVDKLSDGYYGVIEIIDGKRYRVLPENVIKATEEEIAEARAKRDAEIEAKSKWAKIGREVNQYKKGDIVQVINTGTSRLKMGDIGEICKLSPSGNSARINARGLTSVNWLNVVGRFELITPVEARFDR